MAATSLDVVFLHFADAGGQGGFRMRSVHLCPVRVTLVLTAVPASGDAICGYELSLIASATASGGITARSTAAAIL